MPIISKEQILQKTLRIQTFGGLSLYVNGDSISVQTWKSPKVYQLLLFIIAAGGKNVSVHQICDAMWSNHDADQALQNFEFILRRLRQTLQKHLPSDVKANQVIQLHHEKISLNPDYCDVDFCRLNDYIKQARSLRREKRDAQALMTEQHAASILQGMFLEGEEDMVTHYRDAWHTRLCNWIHDTVTHWKSSAGIHQHDIMDLLDLGMQINPNSERLLIHRIQLLHQAGHSIDAIHHYRDWATILQETLALQPSKATQQVYHAILSEQ